MQTLYNPDFMFTLTVTRAGLMILTSFDAVWKYSPTAFTYSSRINGLTALLTDPSPGVEAEQPLFSADAGSSDYLSTNFMHIAIKT